MARTSGTTRDVTTGIDFLSLTEEYIKLKESMDFMKKRSEEIRTELFQVLDEEGLEDDKGNLWIELPEEITEIRYLQKQCRVKRELDEQVAEEIISENNLGEMVYKTVQVIDQEAVMQALADNLITEEDVDKMYPPKVTWALTTPKK
jgi:hypothetical protein